MSLRSNFATALLLAAGVARADSAQESVVFDPASGNYVLTYCCDESGQTAADVFEPATKVVPWIDSSLKHTVDGPIEYRFGISIAKESRRPLEMILLDPVSSVSGSGSLGKRDVDMTGDERSTLRKSARAALSTPTGWTAFVNPSDDGGLRLGWSRHRVARVGALEAPHGEFMPGSAQRGFGFRSADLPGVGVAQFRSKLTGPRAFSGTGPAPDSEVEKALRQLEDNDFVARFAAVPTFAVPSPFNAGALLQAIRDHARGWADQNLMERDLATSVDGSLASAVAAAQSGDLKRVRKELQDIRQILKQQFGVLDEDLANDAAVPLVQHDRRLAARVLDFNVKYIQKHLDEN